MKKGAGAWLVFVSPLGVRMRYMVHIHFPSFNNVAKYEVPINSLRITVALGIQCLDVRGDSQLAIMGVLTPIPLRLSLGWPGSMGSVHPKDDMWPS